MGFGVVVVVSGTVVGVVVSSTVVGVVVSGTVVGVVVSGTVVGVVVSAVCSCISSNLKLIIFLWSGSYSPFRNT